MDEIKVRCNFLQTPSPVLVMVQVPHPDGGSTQDMIAEEDPDGDGIVTKEEFTKMLERKKTDSPNIQ